MKRSIWENLPVHATRFLFLVNCVLIMMYSVAMADDGVFIVNDKYTDAYWFAKGCHHATKRSVTVYSDDELTQPVTTIPAQTFIKTLYEAKWIDEGRCANHIEYITYPGGSRGKGWIEDGSAVGSLASAYSSDGTHLLDLKLNNKKIINQYNYSSDPYVEDDPIWGDLSDLKEDTANSAVQESPKSDESGKASTTSQTGTSSNGTNKTAKATFSFSVKQDGENYPVELVTLGSLASKIKTADGTITEVSNGLLELEGVPISGHIARIADTCSLRERASEKGTLIKKAKAGNLIIALGQEGKFSKIYYQGKLGYVLTSCIEMMDETIQSVGTGTIIYSKEKPNVKDKINIRSKADKSSEKVAEWRTGTEVYVFSHPKGWYEIEYEGIHGFIMDRFLILPEE